MPSPARFTPHSPLLRSVHALRGIACAIAAFMACTHGASATPVPFVYAVSVNGVDVSDGADVMQTDDGTFLIKLDDAHAWRIVVPEAAIVSIDGTMYADLRRLAGSTLRLDASSSTIRIVMRATGFQPSLLGISGPGRPASTALRGTGGFANYEVDGSSGASGFTSLGLTGGIVRGGDSMTGGVVNVWSSGVRSITRVPVFFEHTSLDTIGTTIIGETQSGSGTLGAYAPFVGFHRGTDLTRATTLGLTPGILVNGILDAPSAVTVYANHNAIFNGNVLPGPYAIVLPGTGGGGTLETVYRDASGAQHSIVQSFLSDPQLLKAGFTEYGIDAGFLATPGTTNYSFRAPFGAASERTGVSDRFTREWYADAEARGAHAGYAGEATLGGVLLARAGVTAAIAAHPGTDFVAGLGTNTRKLNVYAQYDAVSARYATLAGASMSSGFSTNASMILSSATSLTLGTTYQQSAGTSTKSWTSQFSTHVWHGNVVLAAGPGITGARAYNLTYTRSFGRATAIGRTGTGGTTLAQVFVPSSSPNGVNTSMAWTPATFNAGLDHRDALMQQQLTFSRDTGNATTFGYGADGTIAVVGGRPFFGNEAIEAFGMVDAAGLAGVRVYVNDQYAGRTNRTGRLFLASLQAYQPATVRLEGADIPIDVGLTHLVETVTPQGRGALVVRFEATTQYIVHLDGPPRAPLTAGLSATAKANGASFPIGDDGVVYLENVDGARVVLDVERDEAPCSATIVLPAHRGGVIDLGHVPCVQ